MGKGEEGRKYLGEGGRRYSEVSLWRWARRRNLKAASIIFQEKTLWKREREDGVARGQGTRSGAAAQHRCLCGRARGCPRLGHLPVHLGGIVPDEVVRLPARLLVDFGGHGDVLEKGEGGGEG